MQPKDNLARVDEHRTDVNVESTVAAPANDDRVRRPRLGPAFFLALIDGMARRGKRSRTPGAGAIG